MFFFFIQDTAHQHLLTARAIHAAKSLRGEEVYQTLDRSSLVAGTRVAAGLDPFDSARVRSDSTHLVLPSLTRLPRVQHDKVVPED